MFPILLLPILVFFRVISVRSDSLEDNSFPNKEVSLSHRTQGECVLLSWHRQENRERSLLQFGSCGLEGAAKWREWGKLLCLQLELSAYS